MKAVVFGGSGFIGSHVADHLSYSGYETTIFDLEESKWLRENQKMIIGDIMNFDQVNKSIKGSDVVYNFAGLSDLEIGLENPILSYNSNVLGNINIMNSCHDHKIKRFIYASTVYVHSREGGFYRCSKEASESFIQEFYKPMD